MYLVTNQTPNYGILGTPNPQLECRAPFCEVILVWVCLSVADTVYLPNHNAEFFSIVYRLNHLQIGKGRDLPDQDRKTPLQHAKASGYKEIVKILEP